jgi:hypothetical protein
VLFYPVSSVSAIPEVRLPGGDRGTVMVAVPISALSWPVRDGSDGDGRSGMVVEGAGRIKSGDLVAFCKVVVVAPARVCRDGRVQAGGRPCDHARLGAAEVELDAACGPEAIERVAAGVRPAGKIKAKARREMSIAFTIRAVLLMTLMPDADARQVMGTLLGDLLAVPWRREHAVASGTVLSSWRTAIGPAPPQQLEHQWLAAAGAGHHDGPAGIDVGGGLRVGAIDGTVTRMPDTKANRRRYGTAGTAGSGYPQIRSPRANDAFSRAGRAVVTGPAGGGKAEAEQKLLDRMLIEYAGAFTRSQLWIMDRNFPGVPRITRMIAKTHVLIRVKSDIRLERARKFLPDGSWLARIAGGGMSLTVRVIEYHVTLEGQTTPELFCLITDLLDHEVHPAHLLAAAYRWRWDGAETALREAKSTINAAGPGTGAILRSATPDLVDSEHAAWTIATGLVRATLRSATAVAAPFAKGPRAGQPVQARHLSFAVACRTVVATVRAGTATASLPTQARTAAHQAALHLVATARSPSAGTGTAHEGSRAVSRSGTPRRTSTPAPPPPSSTSAAPPRPEQRPRTHRLGDLAPPRAVEPRRTRPDRRAPSTPPHRPRTGITLRTRRGDHHLFAGIPRTASTPWHCTLTTRSITGPCAGSEADARENRSEDDRRVEVGLGDSSRGAAMFQVGVVDGLDRRTCLLDCLEGQQAHTGLQAPFEVRRLDDGRLT